LGGINTCLGGLEIHTGEIQHTLTTHVQNATQWHQQQQQQFVDINTLMRQQQEAQMAYWRSMGYNPGP
jgi:ADP-glucose pyrophosphorylase